MKADKDLLDELEELLSIPEQRQLGDITRGEWAGRAGIGYQKAARDLDRLVADGILVKVEALDKGKWRFVYRKAEKERG